MAYAREGNQSVGLVVKLLLDMNISPDWVSFLHENGVFAQHWIEIGIGNEPDEEIFNFAYENGFVIMTNNLDFGAILAQTNAKLPSVIQFRYLKLDVDVVGERLLQFIKNHNEDLSEGVLATLEPDKNRVKILPIHPDI